MKCINSRKNNFLLSTLILHSFILSLSIKITLGNIALINNVWSASPFFSVLVRDMRDWVSSTLFCYKYFIATVYILLHKQYSIVLSARHPTCHVNKHSSNVALVITANNLLSFPWLVAQVNALLSKQEGFIFQLKFNKLVWQLFVTCFHLCCSGLIRMFFGFSVFLLFFVSGFWWVACWAFIYSLFCIIGYLVSFRKGYFFCLGNFFIIVIFFGVLRYSAPVCKLWQGLIRFLFLFYFFI